MKWSGEKEGSTTRYALVVGLVIVGLGLFAAVADAHNFKGVGRCGDAHYHCWKGKYQRTLTAGEKWKARRVASCESGMQRTAHGAGGLYHSYFQYDAQTAAYAGFTRHVDLVSYFQQAVRTIRLVRREGGWGRWPHCGYV